MCFTVIIHVTLSPIATTLVEPLISLLMVTFALGKTVTVILRVLLLNGLSWEVVVTFT